ncbi:MAG: pantetheine-phosphate adenylyltransferase [Methylocystis sp.]|nr:pantetheine-phosphate adenylyltransferase [Methylocystis sp.]MBI3276111.1 pantetheine-phosphate adenylyltransferase [Methylocystis sp.]
MTRIALYPGSFDPLTLGHVEVIRTGAALCDRLIVAIGAHHGKTPLLALEERVELIGAACAALDLGQACRFEVVSFAGLVVDAAKAHRAHFILRGLRDGTDFDYEMQMAGMNLAMAPQISTIFLAASPPVRHITASLVRQIAMLGGDVSRFVAPQVADALRRAVARRGSQQ